MSRLGDRLRGHRRDEGVSLVELLVSSAVLLVILPVAGILLYTGTTSQRAVRSTADASAGAQTIVASVGAGVRNATALRLTGPTTDNPDQLLVARVLADSAGSASSCHAWFYSAARRTLYARTVPVTGSTTALTAPGEADLAQWTSLAEDVQPQPGLTVFTRMAELGGADPYREGVRLAALLDPRVTATTPAAARATGTSTTISTSFVPRPQGGQTKGDPCFSTP